MNLYLFGVFVDYYALAILSVLIHFLTSIARAWARCSSKNQEFFLVRWLQENAAFGIAAFLMVFVLLPLYMEKYHTITFRAAAFIGFTASSACSTVYWVSLSSPVKLFYRKLFGIFGK